MKKLSYLILTAAIGSASLMALPATAATSSPGANLSCSSSTAAIDLKHGVYNQLQMKGQTLQNVQLWGDCVEATFNDGHGNLTTAFYDPDTLQLLQTWGPNSNMG
jgi:hypothetical protein